MMGMLGFFLIGVAIVFFVTFLMGDSLNTKKINLALSIIVFLAVLIIGAYLITEYSGI